ncbi:MAG: hypothetical protein AAF960_02555, partial [Bacteroidota bacterium]
MNEKNNNNGQIKTGAGVVVGMLAYFLVKQFFFAPPAFDKVLLNTANEINKSLPRMVDSETQLDKT